MLHLIPGLSDTVHQYQQMSFPVVSGSHNNHDRKPINYADLETEPAFREVTCFG
jgi:hypothetical protein